MIKAGIFDVGGVLHGRSGEYILHDIAKTLGIERKLLDEFWVDLLAEFESGKITEEDFWQKLKEATHTTKVLPKESLLLREFIHHYDINNKVFDVVRKLKEKGYKLAVLSNTNLTHVTYNRTRGLYKEFPLVVLSYEVGIMKPDPAIYMYTLSKLDVRPEEAFFVDDLPENVEAARRLDIHGILFKNANQMKEKIKKLGVAI